MIVWCCTSYGIPICIVTDRPVNDYTNYHVVESTVPVSGQCSLQMNILQSLNMK